MLFRKTAAGGIEIADDPASMPIQVPLDFSYVSALRRCEERGELLASATPKGATPPSVSADERGERGLFACRPGEEWRRIGTSFADDPVATTDRYIASRGAGITVFGDDGSVLHAFKKGRFNWGPPSLSLSPDGSYLAWVRWRGDDKKLCVMRLADYRVTEHSHSLYRYAWLDDRRIVFLLGSPPRVLDVSTGAVRRFLGEQYSDVAVAGERVWLTNELNDAVVRCTLDGSDLAEVWSDDRPFGRRLRREKRRIETLVPIGAESAWLCLAVYRGYRIVRREERWIGPAAGHATGWAPLLDCHQPEFRFLLPFAD